MSDWRRGLILEDIPRRRLLGRRGWALALLAVLAGAVWVMRAWQERGCPSLLETIDIGNRLMPRITAISAKDEAEWLLLAKRILAENPPPEGWEPWQIERFEGPERSVVSVGIEGQPAFGGPAPWADRGRWELVCVIDGDRRILEMWCAHGHVQMHTAEGPADCRSALALARLGNPVGRRLDEVEDLLGVQFVEIARLRDEVPWQLQSEFGHCTIIRWPQGRYGEYLYPTDRIHEVIDSWAVFRWD